MNSDNNKLVEIIADSFLFNQKQMSKVSKSNGFKHFLVIKPTHSFHQEADKLNKLTESDIYFVKNVIKNIMNSDYCNNPCLDLSEFFDNGNYFMHTYTGNSIKKADDWLHNGIFKDEVHINNRDHNIISEHVGMFLKELGQHKLIKTY